MKKMTDSGTVQEYQGEKLASQVDYNFDYEVYENLSEAQSSEDWPGDGEVLKMVNQKRFTSAKAQAYQKATKPLKEAYEASPKFLRKQLVDALIAANYSAQEAEGIAAAKFGA